MAKTLNFHKEMKENTISGGTKMIDIPVSRFGKDDVHFAFGANMLKIITARIQKMIGNEYSIVGDFSILTTPNGAQKQFIHSDNILKNRYNGLIVLSDTATPTLFLPKQQPDVAIYSSPLLDVNRKIVDVNIRSKLKEKYSLMSGPVEEIERQMRPLSSRPLKRGDLVLFEAEWFTEVMNLVIARHYCFSMLETIQPVSKKIYNSMWAC
jgi:hypothetical protein